MADGLMTIVARQAPPLPWSEGEKIPWHDPAFSARMLQEHLSQEHDAASRRSELIAGHVAWIHDQVLAGVPARILDLGCGPGLYANALAGLGHRPHGIDFSPASITYARERAQAEGLPCTYDLADIRQADYGDGYNLAMLIFGESNVFRPADLHHILVKARSALVPGGTVLLEAHTYSAIRQMGGNREWYSSPSGLFSPRPHLCLMEQDWHEREKALTERYWIVDAATSEVTLYGSTMQAYTDEGYHDLLLQAGFGDVRFWPSLLGTPDPSQASLFVIQARRAD